LRELRDIDSRWDVDVMRAPISRRQNCPPEPRGECRQSARYLTAASQRTPSNALSAALPELRAAVEQKPGSSSNSRKIPPRNQPCATYSRHGRSRSAAATLKPHPPALDSALATLSAVAPLYYWLAQDSQRANLGRPPPR
jgi:hypothetical protein